MEVTKRLQPGAEMLWAIFDKTDRHRDRAVSATVMNTGLRASSISELRIGDVGLETLTLRVGSRRVAPKTTFP